MVFVLAIGDFHIPARMHDLPAKFKKLLAPGKIQQILCTGNVCDQETWEYLKTVAPDVRCVRGDCDANEGIAQTLVIRQGQLRLGVIHGHQVVPLGDTDILAAMARKLDVDVLISGGTHEKCLYEKDGRFYLNPGTATGAYTPTWKGDDISPVPSFALLDIQGPNVMTYLYYFEGDDIKVSRREYRKGGTQQDI